jgi:23S rRNA (adenine2503-C2)-methyltransferase
VEEVVKAAGRYARTIGRPVTFEYVLIAGINDTAEDARRLAKLVRGVSCKINLIPYNPVPGKPFRRPQREQVKRFMKLLYPQCPAVTLRDSRGPDIQAACGQLRAEATTESC